MMTLEQAQNKYNTLENELKQLEIQKQVKENELQKLENDLKLVGVDVSDSSKLEELKEQIVSKIESLEAQLNED